MKTRWLAVGLSVAFVVIVGAFASIAIGLNNKYDGWMEEQINGALSTSLTFSEITGKYIFSMPRPDSAGFTFTDAIIEIEPVAFAQLLDDAAFPASWEKFDGNSPPLPTGGSSTLPWWREGGHNLAEWSRVRGGYQRVVESENGTLVFLLIPDLRLLRWRLYSRSAS